MAPPAPPPVERIAAPVSRSKELFDFDTLLSTAGGPAPPAPSMPEAPVVSVAQRARSSAPARGETRAKRSCGRTAATSRWSSSAAPRTSRRLAVEQQRIADERRPSREQARGGEEAERQRALTLQELEEWLSAIAIDRQHQRSADASRPSSHLRAMRGVITCARRRSTRCSITSLSERGLPQRLVRVRGRRRGHARSRDRSSPTADTSGLREGSPSQT